MQIKDMLKYQYSNGQNTSTDQKRGEETKGNSHDDSFRELHLS